MVSDPTQETRPCRGGIYLDPNFRYRAGNQADKYVVVLNKLPHAGSPIVVVPATTDKPSVQLSVGCNPIPCIFFLPANACFFPRDTYIQLDQYVSYRHDEFCRRIQSGAILHKHTLDYKTLRDVLTCFQHQEADVDVELYDLVI
jgi:hypothetical protein